MNRSISSTLFVAGMILNLSACSTGSKTSTPGASSDSNPADGAATAASQDSGNGTAATPAPAADPSATTASADPTDPSSAVATTPSTAAVTTTPAATTPASVTATTTTGVTLVAGTTPAPTDLQTQESDLVQILGASNGMVVNPTNLQVALTNTDDIPTASINQIVNLVGQGATNQQLVSSISALTPAELDALWNTLATSNNIFASTTTAASTSPASGGSVASTPLDLNVGSNSNSTNSWDNGGFGLGINLGDLLNVGAGISNNGIGVGADLLGPLLSVGAGLGNGGLGVGIDLLGINLGVGLGIGGGYNSGFDFGGQTETNSNSSSSNSGGLIGIPVMISGGSNCGCNAAANAGVISSSGVTIPIQ